MLGLLWTGPNRRVEWVAAFMNGGAPETPEAVTADEERRRKRHDVEVPDGVPFSEPERRIIGFTRSMTPEDLVGFAGTFSSTIALGPAEREEYLASVRALVAEHPDLRGRDRVELPLGCLCWRARRL